MGTQMVVTDDVTWLCKVKLDSEYAECTIVHSRSSHICIIVLMATPDSDYVGLSWKAGRRRPGRSTRVHSSQWDSSLSWFTSSCTSPSITPSVFHSSLKIHLFYNLFYVVLPKMPHYALHSLSVCRAFESIDSKSETVETSNLLEISK